MPAAQNPPHLPKPSSGACPPSACAQCPTPKAGLLQQLGLKYGHWDYCVALAGNPNTGKSTVFNNLTGLNQHTGNWPGKTVQRAEGGYSYGGRKFKLVDLPGAYSLLSTSPDEEVARDFILFGRPQVTVVVADATALERNLNLTLQIMQITDRVILCLNMMDEARAHGLRIDLRGLTEDLGIPIVPAAARQGQGMDRLLEEIAAMAQGQVVARPRRIEIEAPGLRQAVTAVAEDLERLHPGLAQREWIALRLLSGDTSIATGLTNGSLAALENTTHQAAESPARQLAGV